MTVYNNCNSTNHEFHFVHKASVLLRLLINSTAYDFQTLLSADWATMWLFKLYGTSSKMLSRSRVWLEYRSVLFVVSRLLLVSSTDGAGSSELLVSLLTMCVLQFMPYEHTHTHTQRHIETTWLLQQSGSSFVHLVPNHNTMQQY